MTHPAYPSRQELHREAIAGRLMATQAESTAAFVKARDEFIKVWDSLDFPLGSPVIGYDIEDIMAHLDDWSKVNAASEDAAMELARDAA